MKTLSKYVNPQVISKVGAFDIKPKGIVEGALAGAHKSPFQGFSVEFAGHREYMPGDDIKHIDWAVYYKRDKYFIKQYEAETNMVVQVLLDGSESMRFGSGDENKLDYGARLAVTLAWLVTRVRDSVGMGIFDEKVADFIPPSNSLEVVYKLARKLEEFESRKTTVMKRSFMDFAERLGRRQLVVIISDCLIKPDDLANSLARLRFDLHEVVLFHVMDPYEVDFPLEGPIKFKGLEQMGEVKMDARRIRQAYVKRFKEHCQAIGVACEKNDTEYVPVNTGRSITETMMGYLESRTMLMVHK